MKTRILSLLVVAVFFISTSGFAQVEKSDQRNKRNPEHKKMMMERYAQKRGEHQKLFTEEQHETIKELRLETAKKVKPLRNELRELTAHQQTLTTADQADLKAINKNIDKMSEVKTELAKVMAAQHQEVRALLTEEQLLKFDSMKMRHGKKQGPKGRGNEHFGRGA